MVKCVPLCFTVDVEWVTVMDVLNLNPVVYLYGYEKRYWTEMVLCRPTSLSAYTSCVFWYLY